MAGISCAKGKAIVFDAENGAELLKRRFRAGGIAAGTVQPYDSDGLHIVKDLDWFKEEIESEGADFVIFDSLRILSSGADENNTEEIEPIMSTLRRLARETGAAIVLVHHRGRDESSPYRGSSAIRDGTDMLFKFGRLKDDPEARHRRVLETLKCRIDEEPAPRWLRIQADRAAGLVYVDEAEPYEGGTGGATVRALADELLESLADEARTRASLARAVGRDPKDGSVGNALKALEEAGRAERTEGGWRRVQVQPTKGLHLAPLNPERNPDQESLRAVEVPGPVWRSAGRQRTPRRPRPSACGTSGVATTTTGSTTCGQTSPSAGSWTSRRGGRERRDPHRRAAG